MKLAAYEKGCKFNKDRLTEKLPDFIPLTGKAAFLKKNKEHDGTISRNIKVT